MSLTFDLTPGGLEEARAELDRIGHLLDQRATPAGDRTPGEAVYRNCRDRSRELLELLPDRQRDALSFSELGARMRPNDDGSPRTKASVRASYRNVKRVESRLKKSGEIDRDVIQVEWNNYDAEGAARYHVRPEDKAAIAAARDEG